MSTDVYSLWGAVSLQLLLLKAVETVARDLSSLFIHGSFTHGNLEFCIQRVWERGHWPLIVPSLVLISSFFFCFWPCIKEDDLELLMLLSPTLECWDSWIVWTTMSSFMQCWGLMTASCMLGKQSINFATSSALFLSVYVLFKHYIVRNTNWHSGTHGCALPVNTTNGTLHCYSKVPGWNTHNSNSLGGYPWLLPGFISKLWTSYSF